MHIGTLRNSSALAFSVESRLWGKQQYDQAEPRCPEERDNCSATSFSSACSTAANETRDHTAHSTRIPNATPALPSAAWYILESLTWSRFKIHIGKPVKSPSKVPSLLRAMLVQCLVAGHKASPCSTPRRQRQVLPAVCYLIDSQQWSIVRQFNPLSHNTVNIATLVRSLNRPSCNGLDCLHIF